MMCLSQTTGYAVHALACIALENGKLCFVRDVAECTAMPKPYLAKIINSLAHHGLVTAKRGYRGGICLSRPPEEISLLQVVEAVEGKNWIGDCLLGLNDCASRQICPTKIKWKKVRQQITDILETTTVGDILPALTKKHTTRKRKKPLYRDQGCTAR
jgi:Rrf2 family protein